MNLLEVKDLRTYFQTDDGLVKAVDGVSFQLQRGETLIGLVRFRGQRHPGRDFVFREPSWGYS